jgi:hypothetical protein
VSREGLGVVCYSNKHTSLFSNCVYYNSKRFCDADRCWMAEERGKKVDKKQKQKEKRKRIENSQFD